MSELTPEQRRELQQQRRREREAEVAATPFAAVSIRTTGIHPTTGRLLSMAVVLLDDELEPAREWHAIFDAGTDPGPAHLHGLVPEDFADKPKFGRLLRELNRLLDGRTLITHDAPLTWGFLVSEANRARKAAHQGRNRNRNRNRRRRSIGHTPKPAAIVDTLATARCADMLLPDTRLRGVALHAGLDVEGPRATVERAQRSEKETTLSDAHVVAKLYAAQRRASATMVTYTADNLRPDRFGLQRSAVRVDAMEAPRPYINPGRYEPGTKLQAGMEFVVAPEIEANPDEIIGAGAAAELVYSEKVTRQTSVLVCNSTTDLRGRAMHGKRKGIPLLADTAFLSLLDDVKPGTPAE